MKISKRIVALVLTLVMVGTIFIGCEKRDQGTDEDTSSSSSSSKDTSTSEKTESIETLIPDFTENVAQRKEENDDTVGWLQVPYLSVDDVVVWSNRDNYYYERRNFHEQYDFNGLYYADFRSAFDSEEYDGSKDTLPNNVVIYGHAMVDDPEDDRYSIKFGPLHDFRDPEFAAEVPYLFFSTQEGNYAYEIFANFVINADNGEVPYNDPTISTEDYYKMITEDILPRSILDYDVEIQPEDKYITLSTCIYQLPGSDELLPYPNWYRYVIMGRLVTDVEAPAKEEVSVTENTDILIDPNGPMTSASK